MILTLGLLLTVQLLLAQEPESYLKGQFRAQEARRFQKLAEQSSTLSPGQEGFDVKYYKLDLKINAIAQGLDGSVTMLAKSLVNNLNAITLDFADPMKVDSVYSGGMRVQNVTQQASLVSIGLDRGYSIGDLFIVIVYYHGSPVSEGFGTFSFSSNNGSPWIWSLSEPYGAKDWWPCKDHPGDKADSLDVWVTCDSSLKVGSEGKLVAVVNNGDGTKTHKWQHRYPIATYLVSIAIADYYEVSGWFKYTPKDSMLVLNYALDKSGASNSLGYTVAMLGIYSDLFGLYPFINEKYGHAQFGWGGGMEHQTMTSLGGFSESLIAHEMAHQWFGDMITTRTWPHVWLNEGFATYCVALYFERKSDPDRVLVGDQQGDGQRPECCRFHFHPRSRYVGHLGEAFRRQPCVFQRCLCASHASACPR